MQVGAAVVTEHHLRLRPGPSGDLAVADKAQLVGTDLGDGLSVASM